MTLNMCHKEKNLIIFDTTLRDGEQSPGASLNHREKMEIANQLALLGVDVIEAGFPIASPGDFASVRGVAEAVKGPVVCGLARCLPSDIDCCVDALSPAASRGRVHVFLATSKIHREFKLRKARQEILRQSADAIAYARERCADVQFSPEDGSRTEPEFLAQVVEAAIDAGAATINIPDTVGYAIPTEFGDLIKYLMDNVPNIGRAMLHVHCHNDLGLAVANSLAAVQNGAGGVECTVNGLGERAGNAALEEIVMAIKTRSDMFGGVGTGIDSKRIFQTSRLVSRLTGMLLQRNKAIVGANAFAHESGIHQDGILKNRLTYEIMRPEDIGIEGAELVLGKHSGRHAFRDRMLKIGLVLSDDEMEDAYRRFIALADKKKHIYDDDLFFLGHQQDDDTAAFGLDYLFVASGSTTRPTATVRLRKGKETVQDAACGDGPVDAVLRTIDRLAGVQGRLMDFSVQSVTVGKDAMGEVSVRVAFAGLRPVSAKAASTDIVEAAAKAYLSCVNQYVRIKTQQRPAADPVETP